MKRFNNFISVASIAGPALLGATAHAQYLEDGDMDDLDPGTNPDVDNPAGAWIWPVNYCDVGLCEAHPEQFTIVPTNTFDPDATGNSLHMDITEGAMGHRHLPNLFTEVIDESQEMLVIVEFDLWVTDDPTVGGGSVYVSGDHGGGGYHLDFDRSAQVSWGTNGDLTAADGRNGYQLLMENYPRDEWQTVQLIIDLTTDTYSVKWARKGDPLEFLAESLEFRSQPLDHLDRFSFVKFGDLTPSTNSYLDNVSVRLAAPGPHLTTIFGDCPGRMRFDVSNVTPDKSVAFIYAFGKGTITIPPGNPCAGTMLRLNASAKLATVERADADGVARFITQVPAQACGKVYMQAIDLASCATSNVEPIE